MKVDTYKAVSRINEIEADIKIEFIIWLFFSDNKTRLKLCSCNGYARRFYEKNDHIHMHYTNSNKIETTGSLGTIAFVREHIKRNLSNLDGSDVKARNHIGLTELYLRTYLDARKPKA